MGGRLDRGASPLPRKGSGRQGPQEPRPLPVELFSAAGDHLAVMKSAQVQPPWGRERIAQLLSAQSPSSRRMTTTITPP
jgi:hypothetical protein